MDNRRTTPLAEFLRAEATSGLLPVIAAAAALVPAAIFLASLLAAGPGAALLAALGGDGSR